MNGTRFAAVVLVVLLAFPAVAAGVSNGPPVATDPPRAEGGETTPGQTGVLAQQSGTPANGSTATGGPASPDADFEVVNVDSALQPGEQGTVTVTIENQGEDATDAVVSLQSRSSSLAFGGSASANQFVGEWDAGENRTVEVDAAVPSDGAERNYPVGATVSYDDDDGNRSRSAPLTFGVTPAEGGADDFTITEIDSNLQPGEQGTVEVTLRNQQGDLTDARIALQSLTSGIVFGESANASQFVGDWDEGENRTIEVQANVAPGTTPNEYPFRASVAYTDSDDQPGRAGPFDVGVAVGESEDDFAVVSTDSDVSVGGTGNLTVTLENQGEDVENAVVDLRTLSGSLTFGRLANTSEFVGDWEAGERRTIETEISAAPSADERDYPLAATVSYEVDGQQTRAGPYSFGIAPDGEQAFTLDGVDDSLAVGGMGTVSGTITNDGPKNATDATVVFAANATGAIAPRQSEVVLGDLSANESVGFDYPFAVNGSTEPGERRLPFVVQYRNADGETVRSDRLTADVTVGERTDEFALENVTSDVQVGDTGTVTLALRNTGSDDRTDASVTLESSNAQVVFGDSTSATRYVGDWGSNETETVSFQTTATPDASVESYALDARVNYRNDEGQPARSQQLSTGIAPRDEQAFAIDEADTTLRIGRDGYINGTVTNTGPLPANDTTVRLGNLTGITSDRAAYPVGDLAVGENATFSFPVSVRGGATGPQQVRYAVDYADSTGDQRTDTGLTGEIRLASRRPLLTTSLDDPNVTVGESRLLNVSVTNDGTETLRNIRMVPNASGSLELTPTSSFVSRLEPGETATRRIDVDADDIDNPTEIPLGIGFQYETESNEVRGAQAPPVGIDVVAAESGLITGPVIVGAVLVIIVLAGVILYLR